MTMKSTPLSSSALAEAGYDTDTMILTITFNNGRSYDYHDVPEEVYDELVSDPSPGRYLNERIRGVYF